MTTWSHISFVQRRELYSTTMDSLKFCVFSYSWAFMTHIRWYCQLSSSVIWKVYMFSLQRLKFGMKKYQPWITLYLIHSHMIYELLRNTSLFFGLIFSVFKTTLDRSHALLISWLCINEFCFIYNIHTSTTGYIAVKERENKNARARSTSISLITVKNDSLNSIKKRSSVLRDFTEHHISL